MSAFFDFPKPLELIKRALTLSSNEGDVVLDFFSGSATTAEAVMRVNSTLGGQNRKFVLVQLPEPCDEKTEAFKAGYRNICEIGKERIRRAGKKIKSEAGLAGADLDVGFRVLKCDLSNVKDVFYAPNEYRRESLLDLADNIKKGRTPEDLLFQAMLELGVLPSSKIEESTVAGRRVFSVDAGRLIACFEKKITSEVVVDVFAGQPFVDRTRGAAPTSANDELFADEYLSAFPNEEIRLSGAEQLKNLQTVQERNGVPRSSELCKNRLGACGLEVEMETGTGKTYVYIKTIFELNRRLAGANLSSSFRRSRFAKAF